jgi:hypothetical protein
MGESTGEGNKKKLKLLFPDLTKESLKKTLRRKKIHCN